jgi:hypothetical protein
MGGYVGLAPAGFPNVALSNFAKEFRNNAFVGEVIAPRVPVTRQSYPYVIWNRDNLRVPASTYRAPSTGASVIRRSYSTDSFFCRSHALKGSVSFESEAYGLGLGFSTKQHLTGDLSERINLSREVEIATMALSAVNFPNAVTLSGTSQWDQYPSQADGAEGGGSTDGSHPITQVNAFKALLRQAGVQDSEMVLILSDPVVVALQSHPDIIVRFKYAQGSAITLDDLTSVFRVKCIQASATALSENNQMSWVWGNNAFLGYAKAASDMEDVSCLKTFVWAGGKGPNGESMPAAPGTMDGYGVLEWLDPELDKKTYWQSVDWYYGIKVTAQETGLPILNACAQPTMGIVPSDIEG